MKMLVLALVFALCGSFSGRCAIWWLIILSMGVTVFACLEFVEYDRDIFFEDCEDYVCDFTHLGV